MEEVGGKEFEAFDFLKKGIVFKRRKTNGLTISFNIRPFKGPWGGSNQFVELFSKYLEIAGYRIVYDLNKKTDVIWIIDQRKESCSSPTYTVEDIYTFKKQNPEVLIIHRANNCDIRKKGSSTVDSQVIEACKKSDYTIFLSTWLREYFFERGLDPTIESDVIWNAGDASIFHPKNSSEWDGRSPFRLVTHHWSDNWMKGFDIYQKLDSLISGDVLKNISLTVMGRWPKEITWRAACLKQPLKGESLADELRSHHAYITASRWEPGGMHFLEGLQCGLPVICHKDGGGITEVVNSCGLVFDEKTFENQVIELIKNYKKWRKEALRFPHDGNTMCIAYKKVMERLLIEKGKNWLF